jgi:hypothetical protein
MPHKKGITVSINPIPRFALILQGNHNSKLPVQYRENATVRLNMSHFAFSFILLIPIKISYLLFKSKFELSDKHFKIKVTGW